MQETGKEIKRKYIKRIGKRKKRKNKDNRQEDKGMKNEREVKEENVSWVDKDAQGREGIIVDIGKTRQKRRGKVIDEKIEEGRKKKRG